MFDGVQAGSPLPSVELGVAVAAAAGADAIIALGGGSAVVTARAIVILLAEGGRAQDHATKYPPGQASNQSTVDAAQDSQHRGSHHSHHRRHSCRDCRYRP